MMPVVLLSKPYHVTQSLYVACAYPLFHMYVVSLRQLIVSVILALYCISIIIKRETSKTGRRLTLLCLAHLSLIHVVWTCWVLWIFPLWLDTMSHNIYEGTKTDNAQTKSSLCIEGLFTIVSIRKSVLPFLFMQIQIFLIFFLLAST